MKKIIVLLSSVACVALAVLFSLTSNKNLQSLSAGVCAKHSGNHYSVLSPTTTSSGTKEYYVCCNCHEVILGSEHTEGDGDWTENGIASRVDAKHKAFDPKYYVLYGKFNGNDYWSTIDITQKSDSEWEILNLGLTKGDEFVIRMYSDTWYHFNDVKTGCRQYVEASGENIVIKETGTYDIYSDYNFDNGHIWISKVNTNEPRLVGDFSDPSWSYDEGIAMSLVGNTYSVEIESSVGVSVKITNGTDWYGNWDKTSNENKNAYVYTCYTVDGNGNARFNVDGTFKISFVKGDNPLIFIEKISVSSNYKTYETVGSVSASYYLEYVPVKNDPSKVVYHRGNQIYATNEIIQVKHNAKLLKFGFSGNSIKNKFTHYNDEYSSYIRVDEKVSDYCDFYLFLNTSDMTYTVEITYSL